MASKYELFGKYILLDKVAAGGMAEVYRVKAPGAEGIGKILAIKRILPQYSSNSEFIEMFKTEAKIAINLTQANISQIYEFGVEEDQFFLLMEYIDGRNLRQVLSRCTKTQRAMTIEQCVYIISQVATGLDFAHRCIDKDTGGPLNIIHRDMSPQNIMVTYEGEVKIVDFGIAKAESKIEVTRAGTLKGKFGYMSPEQAEGLELDSRTDIFSVGIVLWELLSGERLFVANNEVNTIRKIKECQIPSLKKINPHIHEELERITMKALAKDRNLRYQTAAELHRDLSRFLYRVNPEFTAHDVAVAIKTLFKDDILEDRKKSMEFAKITFSQFEKKSSDDDKTSSSVQTQTETNESQAQSKKQTGSTSPANARPTEFKLDPSATLKPVEIQKTETYTHNTRTAATQMTRHGHTRTNLSVVHRGPKITARLMSWLPTILLVIGGGTVALFLYKNLSSIEDFATRMVGRATSQGEALQSAVLGSLSAPKIPEPELGPPVAIRARVMIHSIPAGAQIEIDGDVVGTTPSEFGVDLNKKVTLSLRREGYIPYVKEFIATDSPEDFTATLQKAAVGYLNIDVRPTIAEIYINDQKLGEKLPISRYPIPADKTIVVRAYNPYLGTSDQQTIMVKQDTVKSITLFLRKAK